MKKFLFFLIFSALLSACMKSYDDPEPQSIPNQGFDLKVGNATMSGDTAYAAPTVVLKFWLDDVPGNINDYAFSWDLGDGSTSVSPSPEKSYEIGVYSISVIIMPISGENFERSLTLIVSNDNSFETTIILLEATVIPGGKYNYKIGLKTLAIEGYPSISGIPWITGDFTAWGNVTLSETQTVNQVEYLVYNLELNANNPDLQIFSFGKGSVWANAPNSRYWVADGAGGGTFQAYFTNGQMSPQPISSTLPGNGGDTNQPGIPATTRTQIIYGTSDSLRIYINYGVYAAGDNPFLSQMTNINVWDNLLLKHNLPGWGYRTFAINNLINGKVFWRFGPNISQANIFGVMDNSMFYLPQEFMLGLQIQELKNGEYIVSQIK